MSLSRSSTTPSVPAGAAGFPRRIAARPKRARGFSALLTETLGACRPFEAIALSYLGLLSLLILAFHANLPAASRYLFLHAGIAAAILALAWAAQRWRAPALRFARHWYPQLLFLFFYEELGLLVHLIQPAWQDRWLIAFDYALTGVHPTVWLEQFARPWLNDFFQMAYLTYFIYLIVLLAILYAAGELEAFWAMLASTAAAYCPIYLIAILFPVESPYHALAALQHRALDGGPFTWFLDLLEKFGRVHGVAFPSLHIAGSSVALLGAWRYRRWLFWVYLPFYVAMVVSTVYGRYHYIADGLAGMLMGAIGFALLHPSPASGPARYVPGGRFRCQGVARW